MKKKVREPKNPFHPGEILLEEFLQPMGMTQGDSRNKHPAPRIKKATDLRFCEIGGLRERERTMDRMASLRRGPWCLEPGLSVNDTATCQAARQMWPEHLVDRYIGPTVDSTRKRQHPAARPKQVNSCPHSGQRFGLREAPHVDLQAAPMLAQRPWGSLVPSLFSRKSPP